MWNYEKRLQYPVKISRPNPAMAKFIQALPKGTKAACIAKDVLGQKNEGLQRI